jgi:hypothetical protein
MGNGNLYSKGNTMKLGRPIKIEPDIKVCTVCKTEQPKENFALEPSKTNPERRRNQCNTCRKKLVRERNKKNDTYRKHYQNMSEEERKAYIKYKSEMNQIRFKTKPEALKRKKEYDKSDRGIFVRYSNENKRRTRLKRGLVFELTFEQVKEIINKPCTYCGKENCRGIDRIDSNIGYTIENSVPCCFTCNGMKRAMGVEDFKEHIQKIHKHIFCEKKEE